MWSTQGWPTWSPCRRGEGLEGRQVDRAAPRGCLRRPSRSRRARECRSGAGRPSGRPPAPRAGTGRPVTTYGPPSRPGIGKARQTRSARRASSRLARPRWLSASVSTSGQAHADRREPGRTRDVPAASQHHVRPPALQDRGGRAGTARAARQAARIGLERIAAVQAADAQEVDLVPGRGNEIRLGALARPEEADLGALSPKRVGDGDRRYDVPRRAAGRYHDSCHLLRAFSLCWSALDHAQSRRARGRAAGRSRVPRGSPVRVGGPRSGSGPPRRA